MREIKEKMVRRAEGAESRDSRLGGGWEEVEGSPAHFPLVPHDGADHQQRQQQQQEQGHRDGGGVCRREEIRVGRLFPTVSAGAKLI